MSQAKINFFNVCRAGQTEKTRALLLDNMFAWHVYQNAARLCIEHNHVDTFHLIVSQPFVSTHPEWSWESLCLSAMEYERDDFLEFCLAQASEKQLAHLYRFSVVLNNLQGFYAIDKRVNDGVRSTTANQLSPDTDRSIFLRLFPFSSTPIQDFQKKLFRDEWTLCVELVQLRPELKNWLEEQVVGKTWSQAVAQNMLNEVQRAEISARLPHAESKPRKM